MTVRMAIWGLSCSRYVRRSLPRCYTLLTKVEGITLLVGGIVILGSRLLHDRNWRAKF